MARSRSRSPSARTCCTAAAPSYSMRGCRLTAVQATSPVRELGPKHVPAALDCVSCCTRECCSTARRRPPCKASGTATVVRDRGGHVGKGLQVRKGLRVGVQAGFWLRGRLSFEDSMRYKNGRSGRGTDEVQPPRDLPCLRDPLRRPVAGAPVQDLPSSTPVSGRTNLPLRHGAHPVHGMLPPEASEVIGCPLAVHSGQESNACVVLQGCTDDGTLPHATRRLALLECGSDAQCGLDSTTEFAACG